MMKKKQDTYEKHDKHAKTQIRLKICMKKNSDMMFEERSKHRVRRIKPTIIS